MSTRVCLKYVLISVPNSDQLDDRQYGMPTLTVKPIRSSTWSHFAQTKKKKGMCVDHNIHSQLMPTGDKCVSPLGSFSKWLCVKSYVASGPIGIQQWYNQRRKNWGENPNPKTLRALSPIKSDETFINHRQLRASRSVIFIVDGPLWSVSLLFFLFCFLNFKDG